MAELGGTNVDGVNDRRNVTPATPLPTFEREMSAMISDPSTICIMVCKLLDKHQ
jgi:hypothetical protein